MPYGIHSLHVYCLMLYSIYYTIGEGYILAKYYNNSKADYTK